MELDPQTCYRALQTRDSRFDGRFFTAVKTTGIYCRPICPARIPKPENCQFFLSAAAAEDAGFRACLRCHPELSPGFWGRVTTEATVSRALSLIASGALDHGDVATLAGRLGVTDRHLRRLFIQHLGASPIKVAQTQRLQFAKQLLDQTALPITEVALASGFSSVRRFNHVMQQVYERSPRELRQGKSQQKFQRTSQQTSRSAVLQLKLPLIAPYDWPAIVGFLGKRSIPGVEYVTEQFYRRTIVLGGVQGWVEVQPIPGQNYLLARIQFSQVTQLVMIVERLRRLFDLNADVMEIAAVLGQDAKLKPAIAASPGLRVPGAWDGFELAVRAILGQQVSVTAATTLSGRVAVAFGEPVAFDPPIEGLTHIFPTPEVLAQADLSGLGITQARMNAIVGLAQAFIDRPELFQPYPTLDEAIKTWCELRGIGEWTAHYIAMRMLREPDAFPATDLVLMKILSPDDRKITKAECEARSQSWRPWRAYAAMHLWNNY
jgi:AraC family transcriptional regulator, regulatory protein of adaptative response / DNA-3-methyladenine glycosylase II